MSSWFLHLLLGSIGLLFTALLARTLLAGWKREPLASYRLLRIVLAVALVLPALQFTVQGTRFPGGAWLTDRLASIVPSELDEPVAPGTPHELDPTLAMLSAAELERLSFSFDPTEERASIPEVLDAGSAEPSLLVPGAVEPDPAQGPSFWSILGLVYLTGVALRLAWTGLRLARTKRLLQRARPVRDPAILELWESVRSSSPIAARIELLCTPEIRVPMCSGLGRPVILLPQRGSCAPSADVLRCVLLHELVHLERRDGWVVLAQELLQAPFWFHPAARWLSRHLDLFRELSCDASVALRTGHPKRYAAALVEYAEWMQREIRTPHATSAALLPWTTTHGQLSRRIEMLLTRSTARPAGPRRFLVGGAFAFLPFIWGSQLALASCLCHAQSSGDDDCTQDTCPHQVDEVAVAPVPAHSPQAVVMRVPAPALAPAQEHAPHAGAGPTLHLRTPSPAEPMVFLPRSQGDGSSVMVLGQDQELPMIGLELETQETDGHGQVLSIQRVVPGSLAERSGIEDGDVIIEVEGEPATLEQLNVAKRHLPGGQILVRIVRDGEPMELVIDGQGLPHGQTHVRVAPHGGVEVQPLVVGAMQSSGEAIQRAREALERALAAQPDNGALREALEALEQARPGYGVYQWKQPMAPDAPPVPHVSGLHVFGDGHPTPTPPSAPGVPGVKMRRFAPEAMGAEVRRKVEEARHGAERAKIYADSVHERHEDPDGSLEGREQELRELRALLEERRRELEALRARLEALRAERQPEGSAR